LELDPDIEPIIADKNINKHYIALFLETSKLEKNLNKEQLNKAFGIYIGLAKLLNLTDNDIKESYISKNKVNFKRIANNY
jgi:dimeric dUTPase (all-alpha-NTP-PPase superfamily)